MMPKIVYEKELVKEERKIDTSIFKKRGNSKTFNGFLIQKIKEAHKSENKELVFILSSIYNEYIKFQQSERVRLDSWKGKSSFKVIETPEKFIIITYQKPDKESKAKEVQTEILRSEVNEIFVAINKLKDGNPIPTSTIAEFAYKRAWKDIFSDRPTHIRLNLILRLLEYKKLTKYKGGFTTLNE